MTHTSLHHSALRRMASLFRVAAFAAALVIGVAPVAAESVKKSFNLSGGDAVQTLKQFSEQSGEQIIYPAAQVRGVKTNAVSGEHTTREALEAMLAGTGFVAVQDEKTGALAIKKSATGSEEKNVDSRLAEELQPAVKLEEVRVLGTRIRQAEFAGPSPVSTYDRDYIDATGAMTLFDFLNRLPQTYSGIASGRGSAPDEFNPDFGQRTETSSPPFNFVLGASDSPPAQTGVSGVSLRGLGAGSTLVLVDGRRATKSGSGNRGTDTRQGFVDLNTIPLGMIERIEVITDGASAVYGADAVAGVINIVLKKNYQGTEITGGYKATEHGGGRERNTALTHGFVAGALSGTVSINYYDRQNLSAADRSFAKHQDHTGRVVGTLLSTGAPYMGRNYTLNWGYPAVIQASGGTVSGNFNAIPGIRVVLVPTGATSTPGVAQFVPVTTPAGTATVINASGQRRSDTSSFLDLVPQSQRLGAGGNLQYKVNETTQAYLSFRTSDTRSYFRSQPTTSITGGFGSAVSLPAAYNPFNQNVTVGMILAEWGSTGQRVRTKDYSGTVGVMGKLGQTWAWDLATTWGTQKHKQATRNFNGPGLAPMLIAADPAVRFNPFIDASAPGAPSQAALLETLSVYPTVENIATSRGLDFSADGDVFNLPGGAAKMALGASLARDDVKSTSTNYSSAVTPVATVTTVTGTQKGTAAFAELQIPVFGKPNAAPLFQRLDFQFAGRFEDNGPFTKSVPKYGVSWSPIQSLLVRGSWSEGFRAPGVTEYLVANSTQTLTLTDPRRNPTSTTGVVITRGSSPTPKPEGSKSTFAGIVYEPEFAKGFVFQANYYETRQADALQVISAQNILNNESLFLDRITRADPTTEDIAAGQPGRVTAVNQTFINFGSIVNRSMDFTVDYTIPWERLGRFRVTVAASHTLESTRQIAPGQPLVVLEEDTGSPPKWKFDASLFWKKGPWSAAMFYWYLDGFQSNNAGNISVANSTSVTFFPTPSVSKIDLRLGYEFKDGVWRGYGKKLRVNVGVSNVFDKKPPFSDTLWGFNAGLHSQLILGRSVEFSFNLPIN